MTAFFLNLMQAYSKVQEKSEAFLASHTDFRSCISVELKYLFIYFIFCWSLKLSNYLLSLIIMHVYQV